MKKIFEWLWAVALICITVAVAGCWWQQAMNAFYGDLKQFELRAAAARAELIAGMRAAATQPAKEKSVTNEGNSTEQDETD